MERFFIPSHIFKLHLHLSIFSYHHHHHKQQHHKKPHFTYQCTTSHYEFHTFFYLCLSQFYFLSIVTNHEFDYTSKETYGDNDFSAT